MAGLACREHVLAGRGRSDATRRRTGHWDSPWLRGGPGGATWAGAGPVWFLIFTNRYHGAHAHPPSGPPRRRPQQISHDPAQAAPSAHLSNTLRPESLMRVYALPRSLTPGDRLLHDGPHFR